MPVDMPSIKLINIKGLNSFTKDMVKKHMVEIIIENIMERLYPKKPDKRPDRKRDVPYPMDVNVKRLLAFPWLTRNSSSIKGIMGE